MNEFVHLHLHSEYSLLDGAIRFERLAGHLQRTGMKAVALTDHGSMFGAVHFCDVMEASGIKPIIGSEVYLAPGSMKDRTPGRGRRNYYHLTLIAATSQGYRNLMQLSTAGYLEGFYHKPRIDRALLEKHSEGLLIGSACLQGEVAVHLLSGDRQSALRTVEYYQNLVGKDRYFIELMDHGLHDEKAILKELAALASETGAMPAATNDAHYLSAEDASAHEALLCLQTGKTLNDHDRMTFGGHEFHVKSPDEMARLFSWIPEALQNTVRIAEMCDYSVGTAGNLLPEAPMPDGFTEQLPYLEHLSCQGLESRLGRAITHRESERLEHELKIIGSMGFPGYFLIVSELMRWARSQGIPVGPGRGSAAGSLVSYAVDITDVNPLDHDLSFERFLNPARAQMPDIDLDVCVERRGEIIEHLKNLYGSHSVCQIITFSRMKKKAAVRDIARVLGMNFSEGDTFAKLFTEADEAGEKTLAEAAADHPPLRALVEKTPQAARLIEYADTLEGIVRHAGVHAAGVVITPGRLDSHVPLYWKREKGVTTQYEMKSAEKVGLMKLDVLGLRTVTVINHTEKAIRKRIPDFSAEAIPLDDPETLEMISRGDTVAVFQLESTGMREALRKIGVNRFDDVTAAVAIFRPGSMHMIDLYARNKERSLRGERIEYPHPLLEEVLQGTHGVTVYQEQVMKIANVLAGMNMAEADNLRRAMSKKISDQMTVMRQVFLDGAGSNGISAKKAEEIWDLIMKFAEYGFNKSHAVCYALLAYRTAYLKCHFPAEYMAADMTSEMGRVDRIRLLVREAARLGVKVMGPSVNRGAAFFLAAGESEIHYGLAAVKNVGSAAAEGIVRARCEFGPFKTVFDLCASVAMLEESGCVNRRAMESLVLAGATDCLPGNRAEQLSVLDQAIDYAALRRKHHLSGQLSLFGSASAPEPSVPSLPSVSDIPVSEKLEKEKEMLGFYFSGHPLDSFSEEIRGFTTHSPGQVAESSPGRMIIAGLLTEVKRVETKKGTMGFVTVAGRTGSAEVMLYSDVLENNYDMVRNGALLILEGELTEGRGDRGNRMRVDRLVPLSDARNTYRAGIRIDVNGFKCESSRLEAAVALLNGSPGTGRVFMRIRFPEGRIVNGVSRGITVDPSDRLIADLRGLFQKDAEVSLCRGDGRIG